MLLNEGEYFNIIMGNGKSKVANSREYSDITGPFDLGKVKTNTAVRKKQKQEKMQNVY